MTRFFPVILSILLLLLSFTANASVRQEIVSGPLTGEVLHVLDDDTLYVRIHVWIGQEIETSVRLDGIDAPEIKGKCIKERSMAEAAKEELSRLLKDNVIRIYNIRLEKYAGRVLAEGQTSSGINLSEYMLQKGLARAYHGKKRRPWCAVF